LIGRTDDLATLHFLVDRAGKGQGGVALVSGEAGIGKSRLLAGVKTYAASHGFLLLQGSCFPTDHTIPYAPLLDLLRSFLINQPTALSPPEVEPIALTLLPDVGHVFADGTALPTLTPLDPEQEKRHLFTALAHFFTSEANKHPVLLLIEDLHWSDDTSLEFLHYLARHCLAHRLLILLTYRSDEVQPSLRHFLAHLDRERLAQEISLLHLSGREVEAMLRAIFALPPSARLELPEPIYTLTEGNPFFLEEVLKSLITAGAIFYENGRWQGKPLGELRIPRSVQDAVQQRTDCLHERARHILSLAAVAGRRFDFALLQQLTHYDEQELLSILKELIAAQLVVEESEERFAFRHALTRQAVYADLLVRERRVLHRAMAETLERLYTPALDAYLADLSYHFYEAGAWEKALEYGQRAGEKAQAMYAPHSVIEQLTRSLDAAHHLGRVAAPKITLARGQAYETLGEFEQARSDYERALEIARSVLDPAAEWQSLSALGFLWAGRDYSQTGTYYRQALELARHLNDPLTLAHSLNRLGNWHLNLEQPSEALGYHQEALTLFQQAHDTPGVAQTCDLLGMASLLGGDLVQGEAYYQQAVTLFRQLDDRQGLASSLATLAKLGGIYQSETSVPASISFAECLLRGSQAIKTAREIGSRSAEAYTLVSLGQLLGPRGEYARALEVAQASLAISEQIEHRQFMTFGHWEVGVLYLELLDLPEAQRQLEQALAQAHEVGSAYWIRLVSGFLALAYLLQHNPAQAESILNVALPADAPCQTSGQRIVWTARAELALARRDPGLALSITDRLIASATNLSSERVIPRLWKLRGEALAALQRTAEAETTLEAAQGVARAQELRPLHWRICVSLGKLYQTQKRQGEAEQAFQTARSLIEELAANVADERLREHFLSQATAMLPPKRSLSPDRIAKQVQGGLIAREREAAALVAQGPVTMPTAAPAGTSSVPHERPTSTAPSGLTAREVEVLRLLAQGLTNPQIAEQLIISPQTVHAHLRSMYSKLGVTTRSAATRFAVDHHIV
jgi:DNA-binding NarL/FixJ family response regulator/Tfp pilus assembly protein PilF